MKHTFSGSLALIASVAWIALPLAAAPETKLRDETGKTIVKYVIEVPQAIAPARNTDPAKQVGPILWLEEHDTPAEAMICFKSVSHSGARSVICDRGEQLLSFCPTVRLQERWQSTLPVTDPPWHADAPRTGMMNV